MNGKHFDAIRAKNNIARELRDLKNLYEPVSPQWIEYNLREIEKYIGEANQPSIEDIINDKTGIL